MALLDGSPDEAEDFLRRAVAACNAAHGENHIHTVRATIWLAQHFEMFGQHDEAASVFERLRPVIERLVKQSNRNAEWVARLALAKSHSASSTNLDLADSIDLARDTLERIPRIGAYFPRYVNTLPRIAMAKAQIRSEARSDAIQTLRAGLADRHPLFVYEWFIVEEWLLELLEAEGKTAEVGAVLRDVVEYRAQILTADHPATVRAKERLAEWLSEQG